MLASSKLVGFLPTKDYDAARAFYEGKLQFQFISQDQFALVLPAGPHMLRIVKLPNYTPLQATILGWEVQDIAAVVQWLASRGPGFPTKKPAFGPLRAAIKSPGSKTATATSSPSASTFERSERSRPAGRTTRGTRTILIGS